jgi:hypothetical protein
VSADDALAEEIVPPGARTRYKAGTAMEPAVVEAMGKDKIPSVPVCRGASPPALKWARTYLETIPQAPIKMVRPDPAAAAAQTCAWSLMTPRARVMAVLPDDVLRLRVVNGLLAAGHEVTEVKTFSDALTAARGQRPDAVIVPPDGALMVIPELRKRGEALRTMVICLAGDPAQLAGVSTRGRTTSSRCRRRRRSWRTGSAAGCGCATRSWRFRRRSRRSGGARRATRRR